MKTPVKSRHDSIDTYMLLEVEINLQMIRHVKIITLSNCIVTVDSAIRYKHINEILWL